LGRFITLYIENSKNSLVSHLGLPLIVKEMLLLMQGLGGIILRRGGGLGLES
jgi:hypothetical protein